MFSSTSWVVIDQKSSSDRVSRMLVQMIWGAPALATILMMPPAVQKWRSPPPKIAAAMWVAPPKDGARVATGLARKGDASLETGVARNAAPARDSLFAWVFAPPERLPDALAEKPKAAARPLAARPLAARLEAGPRLLRDARVQDGLRLSENGATFQLADIEPLPAGSVCKRLDGVAEACDARAAARLEIVMRGRAVMCDVVNQTTEGVALASCAAGKIDLAEDLVKNGLARRTTRVAELDTRG